MTVGERIKELRLQKRLTQTELGKLVGLTYIQIGRYETNKSNPSADVLNKLASALDTTTDFLMKGTEDEAVAAQLTDKELLKHLNRWNSSARKIKTWSRHLSMPFLPNGRYNSSHNNN